MMNLTQLFKEKLTKEYGHCSDETAGYFASMVMQLSEAVLAHIDAEATGRINGEPNGEVIGILREEDFKK